MPCWEYFFTCWSVQGYMRLSFRSGGWAAASEFEEAEVDARYQWYMSLAPRFLMCEREVEKRERWS